MNAAERLEKILHYLKVTPYRLAKDMGYERTDTLYNILKGKYDISKNLAYRITMLYPELNLEWLLSGKREMINKGKVNISNIQSGNRNYNQQVNDGTANINEASIAYDRIKDLEKEIRYLKDIIKSRDSEIELLRRLLKGDSGNEQQQE